MQNSLTRKPIEIKISTVVAVAVSLNECALTKLEQALKDMTGGAPDFFDDEFAILDLEAVQAETMDWPALLSLFRSFGLNVVAVRNAREDEHAAIRAHGLTIDVVSKARPEVPHEAPAAPPAPVAPAVAPAPAAVVAEPVAAMPTHIPAMIIDTPVRAGQRVYARGCDLIVTASVNNGAEVIADGSIHIYAPLRGRALAGARGNTEARIFAAAMEAELVSIAGIYRTFDNGFPEFKANQPVQIKLVGDSIEMTSMKTNS
ncbi:septum site-determining protein MinC [Undibacterium cyanobacteriorum]|uniref:Probable septum site-determining protein MinC n=1 Tax=Undibacterium cyanobacteriorum TaxID=3073561 RepID=A0ABY9RMF7_9BURK|nr:septum site-determining protein MinC [Undibacterium sp. 20NA77.5]WMW81176.1 septum site-determining protein MinC [Undibacterium sp. 20NA77.5]